MNFPLVLSALLLTGPARVLDIIPSGQKPVTHEYVFEESDWLSREHLLIYPSKGPGGLLDIEAGVRVEVRSKYGATLYYAPDAKWPVVTTGLGFLEGLDLPRADWPIRPVSSLPTSNPVSRALSTLRWVGLEEGRPVVVLVKHETFDAHGEPLSVTLGDATPPTDPRAPRLILLAAVGALGLLGLAVSRKWVQG